MFKIIRTELIIDATSTLARENNPEKNEKLLKEILYYKEIVKNVIMKKFPAKPNSNIKKYTDKLNILIEYDALYKTEFDVSEGMNINKYLYKLDNPDTLEDYNKNLLKIIDIFLNRNITLNGNKDIVSVKINSDEGLEKDDLEMLEDMILVAFKDASKKVDTDKEKKLGKYGQGLAGLM